MKEFLPLLKKATEYVDRELDRCLLYTENNYQTCLLYTLKNLQPNLIVNREVHVNYRLSDQFIFGSGRIDILVETDTHAFILELKANVDCKYVRKYQAQTRRYVQHYETSKIKQGILIVFNSNCAQNPLLKIL